MQFTTCRLIFINAMVCGLEVAATVAFTYLPPILLKAGFAEANMGIILGIGPFVGMFTVSAVGQLSDYWNHKFGQRMYFMLLFALIVSLSLSLLLAVGGIALDYSSQVALNPCESLLSDLLQGSDSLEKGFSIYSGLMSLGGCIGYLVTAVHWPWGQQEEAACSAALVLFLVCCVATILAVAVKTPGPRPAVRRSWSRLELPWRFHAAPKSIALKACALVTFLYQKMQFTTCRLIFINAMVCGLEVAATVAFTYLPPILLKAGFAEANMGIILGIGPFVGMFTVSAVGQLSDYWNHKFGQRMYFMLLFALIVSLSLSLLLAVGGIALDYSSQVALNPCESLLSDLLQGSDSLEKGFSIYSGLMSLGGCIGYLVTAVHWPWGQQEEAACSAALVLFLVCCVATILAVAVKTPGPRPAVRRSWSRLELPWRFHAAPKSIALKACALVTFLYQKVLLLPVTVWKEVWNSPLVLWQLFIADTVSWAASTSYNLFYAHYVGQVVFGGHPNAAPGSLEEDLYNEGVRMGSWGLLLHSISACGYVLLLQSQLIQAYGLKQTYLLGLGSFSVCMLGILVVRDVWLLNLLAAFSGVGFAVMTSIPSALVFYFDITEEQKRGSGADFGILYVGYYLGQTLLSLIMSHVVQTLGMPHCYIAFASAGGLLACYFANKVVFSVAEIPSLRSIRFDMPRN
ncbi:hypothetical protein B566_EDAN014581 [Ephemera danica]|nr:hypothetical protein B566_EDAN014581 [Ephemera danica]